MAECPACKSVIDEVLPECPECGAKTGRGSDAWDADLDVAWMDVDMTGDEKALVDEEELIDLTQLREEPARGAVTQEVPARQDVAGLLEEDDDAQVLGNGILDLAADPPDVDGATRAVSATEMKRMSSGEFGKVMPPVAGPRTIPDLSRDDDVGEDAHAATVVWDESKGRRSSVPFGLSAVAVPDLIGADDGAEAGTGATRNVRVSDEPGTVPGRPVAGPLEERVVVAEPAPGSEPPDPSTTWLWVLAVGIIVLAAAGIVALVLA